MEGVLAVYYTVMLDTGDTGTEPHLCVTRLSVFYSRMKMTEATDRRLQMPFAVQLPLFAGPKKDLGGHHQIADLEALLKNER